MAASGEREGVAPPPGGEEEGAREVWEEAETLAGHFRESLISLRGMDLWPRRASLLAIAGLVVAALLVAGRGLPGPQVKLTSGSVPLVELIGVAVLSTLAWIYLLAGVLHAHWGLRLPVLILFTVMGLTFSVQGVPDAAAEVVALVFLFTRVRHPLTAHQDLAVIAVLARDLPLPLLSVAVVCLLAAVWVVVLGRRRTEEPPRLAFATLLGCAGTIVALYVMETLGSALGSVFQIGDALDEQLTLFGVSILPIVLFVTASDFAEWAEVVAGKAVAGARGVHRAVLPAVAVVSALAILADSVRVAGGIGALAGELAPTLVLGVAAAVASRLLLARAPRLRVRPAGLLVAGVAGYLLNISPPIGGIGLPLWAASLLLVAVAAVVGGRARPALAVPALLFALVLVVAVLDDWHQGGRSILTPDQLRAGGALLCLAGTAFALARYRLRPRGAQLMRLLVVLLLGLQALDWLTDIFTASSGLVLAPLQASFLLLGLLWDVVTSGDAITNVHGRRVPHHSRVLVYFGYEVLAAAAIVWFYATTQNESFRDTDTWVAGGIQLLGTPLLIVFFGLGLTLWARGRPAPPSEVAAEALGGE